MPEVKLIWVESGTLSESIAVKAHSHDYCHLFYVVDGACDFVLKNTPLTARAGEVIIALPAEIHELKVSKDTATVLEIKFSVNDDGLMQNLARLEYPIAADAHTDYFIRSIVSHGRSRLAHFISFCMQYLGTLLLHLTKELHITDTASANSQLIDTAGFSKVTINIIIYLEKNYSNEISLDLIADTLGYNKHYICTAFKKDTGLTIINYMNFLRIRRAAELFSYSDADPLIICNRVGFKNLSHFNHTFKNLTGMPPGHYRRMFPVDVNGNLKEGNFLASTFDDEVKKASEVLCELETNKEK